MGDTVTAPVCFVDTETTGLHPERHEIWEVGLITPDGEEYEWLLNVERLADADPFSLNIGGFHQRHSQGNASAAAIQTTMAARVDRTVFSQRFARLTHGCHLAGAVVSFDEERLRRLLWAEGQQPGWNYHLIDVEALAVGWLRGTAETVASLGDPKADGPDPQEVANVATPPWNSTALSRAVGVDPDDPRFAPKHSALADARWAKAIYEAVMGR